MGGSYLTPLSDETSEWVDSQYVIYLREQKLNKICQNSNQENQ